MSDTDTDTNDDAAGGEEVSLFEVLDLLSDVIEQENEALERFCVADVRNLLANKVALAGLYERQITALRATPEALNELEPEDKVAFRDLATRLARAVQANARLLKANMEAGNRVMGLVVEAVKNEANTGCAYSRAGIVRAPRRAKPLAIAINKTL